MQEITFYVTMDHIPRGKLMDHFNDYPDDDPIGLVVGIPIQINLMLFKSRNTGTRPYPVPDDIVSWKFFADNDFNRSTEPLITVDSGIYTVETTSQTKLVIPISDMSGERLVELLGTRGVLEGITGEVIGYDELDNAVFVMQLDNIVIRNRIA